MLTRMVRGSPCLEAFLDVLGLDLSGPQRQHLLQLLDGLLVCKDHKPLAAWQRQFLDSPDPSNRERVTAADGNTTMYNMRDALGRLSGLPFDVRVTFSKPHPRARDWACEVVNFYLKTQ